MTPEPTRQSHASLALITIGAQSHCLWLGQWNEAWQAISFVGGHREESESYRECMIREICEELRLSVNDDFRVPTLPTELVEFTEMSKRANDWTHYLFALFSVELVSGVADRLGDNPNNHWLSERDIATGMTDNDVPVSPTMKRVFDEAGLWTNQQIGSQVTRKNTK